MEGLPRISMISLDLKESNDAPNLSPLYSYIESHYNERSVTYKDAFKEFLNLRQASVVGSEGLPFLANMKRYFCQLQLFKQRFPLSKEGGCSVNWSWEDSHSNSSVTVDDIRLEEAAIQYNIGCMHCNLGFAEKRIDLESTKIACTHFQCAAWAFQYVLEKYTPLPSADLECDVLRYLNLLMLAQAHECVLEKSMVDQRRANISAKIAFQISDLYKQCQGLLQSENIGFTVNSKQFKLWKRTCSLKEFLYHCLSYYYMALGAEDLHKYGEIIAWLKLAKEKLDKCAKPLKDLKSSEANETIRFVQDVVNGKFESAKKDNDFIYYEKIPEPEMLPPIKGAMLLKGVGFDVNDSDICGQDIFKNLIPMETHISSSIYSEKKAEILRGIQTDVEEKSIELKQFLTDIHWSSDMFSLEDSKVPQELFNCAAFIAANGDEITNIKRIMQDISSISIEVEESLEILSDRMRNAIMDKSLPTWKKFEKEYSEFISTFQDAKESNDQLREAFSSTLNDFKFVNQPLEQVLNLLPSLNAVSDKSETSVSLDDSKRLMGKIEEMRTQRNDLMFQLKSDMLADDVTKLLLGCKSDSEQNKVIDECLKKYDQTIGYLRQNMLAQSNIIDAVVDHNAKIADIFAKIVGIKNERERHISRIIRSFNTYKNLLKKGEEGIEFYRKLGTKVLNLQKNVDPFLPKPATEPTMKENVVIQNEVVEDKHNKEVKETPFSVARSDVESSYSYYSYPTQPTAPNTAPRLKDYLKERKTRYSEPSIRCVVDQNREMLPQSVLSTNQYPYMPWGYYGPPCQGVYNSNYAVSRPRDQGSEFRITQNIQLPAASSEVGCSVYPNYSSLPRPSYSQPSSTSTTCNLAASIDNLASTAFPVNQFTIPYQQQPFYNPNVISMAHSYGRTSVPIPEPRSTETLNDAQKYHYNTTFDLNNFQYQNRIPNQNPSSIYQQNVQYNDSISENPHSHFHQSNYFPELDQGSQQPQQSAQGNIQVSVTNISGNSLPAASPRYQDAYPSSQIFYPTPKNLSTTSAPQNYLNYQASIQDNHQNNHYMNTSSSHYPTTMSNVNYYDSHMHGNSSISSPQQNTVKDDSLNSFSNPTVPISQNIAIKRQVLENVIPSQPNTDLLSSSLASNLHQENSSAILEPTVLTKQEIEDQKEEKRKQIYRKQYSGSSHPLNDNLVLNKFISDAERFMKRATEILDVSNSKTLEVHWSQLINKERMLPKKSSAIGKCSRMKNRIQESVPYDENRVVIKEGKDDYVNASHIVLQSIDECLPRFITFQSPLLNTVTEYWTAIFEQGCELLVQLAQPCDKDDTSKARVVSYWPDTKGQFISVGNKFEISVQSLKEKPGWSERILLVKHLKSHQSRSIWHFQVNNVSNKLPKSHDDFLAFATELCGYYRQQRSLTKPIGISCINGSSVCGVMVLLTTALTIMEITGLFPDIDGILLTMWSQRKNLLDDKHQLAFVYKVISKASSDMLSKRNIVIGPGRLVSGSHGTSSEHSSATNVTVSQPVVTSILDSLFTTQHLQLSELTSAISKWTVKVDDKIADSSNTKNDINSPKKVDSEPTAVLKIELDRSETKKVMDMNLPSSLKHLEDPSAIDFTPTPSDKRRITKKEFEQKINKSYIKPQNDSSLYDPLKSLDPIYNNQ